VALATIPRPDQHLHRATAECVPCGRPGCSHCQHLHIEQAEECGDLSCNCQEFAVGEPCPTCSGEGTVERFVVGLGMTDARCDDCVDGMVA
jgi:hypothetical protein